MISKEYVVTYEIPEFFGNEALVTDERYTDLREMQGALLAFRRDGIEYTISVKWKWMPDWALTSRRIARIAALIPEGCLWDEEGEDDILF